MECKSTWAKLYPLYRNSGASFATPEENHNGKLSSSVDLNGGVKRSPFDMTLTIMGEPALQRGAGSFFFSQYRRFVV
jgi:hypothetical protein